MPSPRNVETGRAPSPNREAVEELVMDAMLQGLVIIGGLTFSLAASLLVEELIFGQIVRVAFARRTYTSKPLSPSAHKN